MVDYAGFKQASVRYPLMVGTGNSLLRDVDPTIFYALEFFRALLDTHLSARLMEIAGPLHHPELQTDVAMTFSCNPERFLGSTHAKTPILALYRTHTRWRDRTIAFRRAETDVECLYVLPPLDAAEAEQIEPILWAVASVLEARASGGWDPAYTPSGGQAGQSVWGEAFAHIEECEFVDAEIGGLRGRQELYFPTVMMKLRMRELIKPALDDFELWQGANVHVDGTLPGGDVVVNLVEANTWPAPTIASVSPISGTKAGGTTVTVTGTGFRVGTPARLVIGNVECTDVVVLSTTQVRGVTGQRDATPTFMGDVTVIADDGQSATLAAGYTYTTP